MRKTACFVGLVMLLPCWAAPGAAQGLVRAVPAAPNQTLSASPMLLMFKWFNLDFERKVSPAVTLGLSASYLPVSGADYARGTVHARFYPERQALTGFYVGVQAGLHRTGSRDYGTQVGAGVDVGHAWLLGPNRDVTVTVGVGTTRLFGGDHRGGSLAIPNVRLLNVGFAF